MTTFFISAIHEKPKLISHMGMRDGPLRKSSATWFNTGLRKKADSMETISEVTNLLAGVPLIIQVILISVLPLVFFPTSFLWIATGAVHGFATGFVILVISASLNFFLAYVIGQRLLRRRVKNLLSKYKLEIPSLDEKGQWEFTIAVRLIPALPQIIQSYFLAISNVRLSIYMVGSLVTQLGYAVAFLFMGSAIFTGELFLFLMALSFALFLHLWYRWRARDLGSS